MADGMKADRVPDLPEATHVSARKVDRRFDSRKVLDGLDLDVKEGEFVALVGKSGCGKSTLLRLIAGLDAPDGGEIRIRRMPLKGLNREARVMFQESRILPWKTVLDNVGLGLSGEERGRHVLDLLGEVGLSDRAGDWPSVLSGGQLQRVALARALASSPDLLLLDEPLGSLDALTRIEMQDLIQRLWREKGFTAVLITHEVEEALVLADRILVMESGRISLEVPVELSRPRNRGTPELAALKSRILDRILGSHRAAEADAPRTAEAAVAPTHSKRKAEYADAALL